MARGGANRGQGRHVGYRKPITRSVRKGFRLTPDEDKDMKEALTIEMTNETDLVRTALMERVKKILDRARSSR